MLFRRILLLGVLWFIFIVTYTTAERTSSSSKSDDERTRKLKQAYEKLEQFYTRDDVTGVKCKYSWNIEFINLATVEHIYCRAKHKTEVTKFLQAVIHGGDGYYENSAPIKCENILTCFGQDSGKRVVITGPPGCGKTTLARKLCKDLYSGGLHHKYQLVAFAELRQLRQHMDKRRDDIDLPFLLPHLDLPELCPVIEEQAGTGVILILDGFDEVVDWLGKSPFLSKLLSCKDRYLGQCDVYVTTRPLRYIHLTSMIETSPFHIEILGFTSSNDDSYIQSYFRSDADRSVKVIHCLNTLPLVRGTCHIPRVLEIVCMVQEYLNDDPLLENLSGIFLKYICHQLEEYLSQTHPSVKKKIHNLLEVPEDLFPGFYQLCEVAYKCCLNQRLILTDEDLGDLKNYVDTRGSIYNLLFSEDIDDHSPIACVLYQFDHKTVQEALGAVHIGRQSKAEQEKIWREWLNTPHMAEVWKMYCGLTKLDYVDLASLSFSLSERAREVMDQDLLQDDDMLVMMSLYEANKSSVLNQVLQAVFKNTIRAHIQFPYDSQVATYAIEHHPTIERAWLKFSRHYRHSHHPTVKRAFPEFNPCFLLSGSDLKPLNEGIRKLKAIELRNSPVETVLSALSGQVEELRLAVDEEMLDRGEEEIYVKTIDKALEEIHCYISPHIHLDGAKLSPKVFTLLTGLCKKERLTELTIAMKYGLKGFGVVLVCTNSSPMVPPSSYQRNKVVGLFTLPLHLESICMSNRGSCCSSYNCKSDAREKEGIGTHFKSNLLHFLQHICLNQCITKNGGIKRLNFPVHRYSFRWLMLSLFDPGQWQVSFNLLGVKFQNISFCKLSRSISGICFRLEVARLSGVLVYIYTLPAKHSFCLHESNNVKRNVSFQFPNLDSHEQELHVMARSSGWLDIICNSSNCLSHRNGISNFMCHILNKIELLNHVHSDLFSRLSSIGIVSDFEHCAFSRSCSGHIIMCMQREYSVGTLVKSISCAHVVWDIPPIASISSDQSVLISLDNETQCDASLWTGYLICKTVNDIYFGTRTNNMCRKRQVEATYGNGRNLVFNFKFVSKSLTNNHNFGWKDVDNICHNSAVRSFWCANWMMHYFPTVRSDVSSRQLVNQVFFDIKRHHESARKGPAAWYSSYKETNFNACLVKGGDNSIPYVFSRSSWSHIWSSLYQIYRPVVGDMRNLLSVFPELLMNHHRANYPWAIRCISLLMQHIKREIYGMYRKHPEANWIKETLSTEENCFSCYYPRMEPSKQGATMHDRHIVSNGILEDLFRNVTSAVINCFEAIQLYGPTIRYLIVSGASLVTFSFTGRFLNLNTNGRKTTSIISPTVQTGIDCQAYDAPALRWLLLSVHKFVARNIFDPIVNLYHNLLTMIEFFLNILESCVDWDLSVLGHERIFNLRMPKQLKVSAYPGRSHFIYGHKLSFFKLCAKPPPLCTAQPEWMRILVHLSGIVIIACVTGFLSHFTDYVVEESIGILQGLFTYIEYYIISWSCPLSLGLSFVKQCDSLSRRHLQDSIFRGPDDYLGQSLLHFESGKPAAYECGEYLCDYHVSPTFHPSYETIKFGLEEAVFNSGSSEEDTTSEGSGGGFMNCFQVHLPKWTRFRSDKTKFSQPSTFAALRERSGKTLAGFDGTKVFGDAQSLVHSSVQHGIDQHAPSSSPKFEDMETRKEPVGQEDVDSSPVPASSLGTGAISVGQGVNGKKGSTDTSGYKTDSHGNLTTSIPSPGNVTNISVSEHNKMHKVEAEEVATENSGEEVVVSRGPKVAESFSQQDKCIVHIATAVVPDTYHKTTLVLGRNNSKPVIKTLKEYIKTKPELNLKPSLFLANLHLQDVLKLKELTDIPSYLVKRSRLECVYKKLPPTSEPASLDEERAETVISSLKWLEKEQTDALKKTLVSNRRKGWNDLKDSIRAVDMVFLPTLVSKLGINIHFTAEPALSEFVGILDELSLVHKNCGLHNITKSQVIHALFVSSASTELLDSILLEDLPEKVSCVTISKVQKYADLYGATKEGYERFLAVILDDVSHKRDRNPLKVLPALPKSPSSVTHCLAVWLAVRAESPSSAVTWEEFVEMTRNLGLDERIIVGEQRLLVATSSLKPLNYEHNAAVEQTDGSPSNESKHLSTSEFPYGREPAGPDRYPSPAVQNDVHLKPSEEHPLSSRFELSSTSSNLAVQNSNTSSSHAFPRAESSHNRVSEEQLLSRKLDPGNPESVMAHAKAVYLTGDYNRTRAILEHFNHHLSVEGKMLRAKLFGLGITHYRQKHYPQAVQHLDELEKVAVEHHAASDVMLSNIYRGECHLAMEKYQAAYDMFNKAKTVYSTDHVAHLYGIVILSKTSVVIKAATCQRHLRNIIAARNLFQKAVEMAVVVREAAEPMSTSSLAFSDALKPLYKDEIAARTSLGNLHQNMSNCPKAVEEYKLALQLQKKLDSKCTTYGWAEGNLGNALVGAHKVKEAIPHLERAYEAAKKYQRDYTAVGRTASNLGSAYQSNKQYKEAEEHFEIALGHAVYCRDAIGQARSLGNIGNVKSAQGKHMDALRCYTETLSLDCDITANIAAYQNRANVYIDLARELAGGNDWDEVSSDVEAVQPKEVQSSEIPVQECTQAHGTGSMRLQLVAPEGSYIKLPLDDEQDILSNKQSLPVSSSGSARRTGSIQQQPLTPFNALGPDDLKVRHRKYYLQKAKDDLEKSTKLIEERFNTIKGEGTTSMALSLFEVNAKGFYNLQKVLTLLGDHQGALQVAEQNRARNLGEILWKKKQDYRLQHRDLPSPFGLKNIWNLVNRERVPLVVLSYIQQSSTMLVHIVFPEEEGSLWRGLPGGFPSGQSGMLVPSSYISEMGFSRNAVDILSTHQSEESEPFRIPSSNYCFMKIDLPKEYFIAKRYGSLARLVDEEPIVFEQYVQKTLMDYLNQKDVELFTPIDFQDDESPLTVLFERFARRFVEEIEQRWPTGREFVVVADQTAHFLPWPLLQDESTKVFLGDRYRVRTYPSLLTMGLMNLRGVEVIELPSQDRFLIIGNPTIPKFEHNGKEITLGRLPHAETEAVQVAHILEANPLLREMATKPTVEYRLQTAQIIHVATHASAVGGYLAFASSIPIVNTARPIDSKDALLFIDDIQKLRIDASLVVLSACDSARGQLVNEGVNSIARAFLAAGAQSVLVSLVRVPDKSASIFMSLFYRFLTHNEFTTSEAIQKSSMVIRCIKSLSQHIHWGGYRLVGRDIRMKYNEECEAAKVAKLLGETSAFPRMKILQELEKAIFRQDRTPPRDVVVVKGMMAYDPAEVVKDFVAKRFKLFPGGVFWYNCSTQKLLEASVKNTLRHLKTIRKEPPKQTRVPDKKRSLDSSPLFEEHYQLIILDSPYDFEKCVKAILNMNGQEVVIKDMNGQEVDIIVIDSMEADRDGSLTKFAHSELIRGCTSVEVEDIDRYTSIQRMAYQLLCKQDFCPYEEDYEAFETIVRFTRGCTSLVKVFEGLLATKEKGIVQEIVRDIEAMKDIVIEYDDEHTTSSLPPSLSSHRPMSTLASLSSAIKETGRKVGSHGKKPKESKKTESLVKNGLIAGDMAKQLSEDDCVLLSEGLEKLPRIMDSMNNFLTVQLTPESHFILQSLSFISQFSSEDSHSEPSFCFPEGFITTLATLVASASRAGSPKEHVEELKRKNLLRPYPQPVLYPLEKTRSESSSLLYIPDVVVKSVTYEMDDADFAFAFNTLSFADHQVNGVSSVFSYQPVVSAVRLLKKKYDFFADSPVTNSNTGQSRVSQIRTKASNKHNSTYFPNDTQPLTLKMPSRKETFDHSAGRASHRQSPPECDSNHV